MVITIAGSVKVHVRGKWYRPGESVNVTEDEYSQLLASGIFKTEEKKEIKPKPKKEND